MSTASNTTTNTTGTVIPPACLKKTADEQLNANLTTLVKILIDSLQDGSIPVKNSSRLQNLTVDDILALAKKNSPVQEIKNYITQNGTNIVEMIEAFNITRDTRYVTSGNIPFKVLIRKELDPSDPTGVARIDVPWIQAKLPYDLKNKDRIVGIHLTTTDSGKDKPQDFNNTITNDVIFDYEIDTDSSDPKYPYIIEARAQKIITGATQLYDVSSYPNDPSKWGTWSKEKFIRVTYLVDASWVSDPGLALPPVTTPNVAITTSNPQTNVIPMTYNVVSQPLPMGPANPGSKPQESVIVEYKNTRIITEDPNQQAIQGNKYIKLENDPAWILIEDPASAKKFDAMAKFLIQQTAVAEQLTYSFNWSPDTNQIEAVNVFVRPPNKIIEQITYNLTKEAFLKFCGGLGLSSYIIQMVTDPAALKENGYMEIKYSSTRQPYGTIDGTESDFGLLVKLSKGEQYPFINFEPIYIPSRIINIIDPSLTGAKSTYDALVTNVNLPARIIEEIKTYLNPLRFNNLVYCGQIPSRVINFVSSIILDYRNHLTPVDPDNPVTNPNDYGFYEPIFKPSRVVEEDLISKKAKQYIPEPVKSIKVGAKIINQELDPINLFANYFYEKNEKDYDVINNPTWVIAETGNKTINIFDPAEDINHLSRFIPARAKINISKLFIHVPNWIINQESFYPMKMEVSSGSIYYIQDLYNMRVVSSLASEEFIPLVTAEGKQQRSEYEFIAVQDQRVFNVTHNPDLVTVFRQGFKLSHGDYYSNGQKIILKSPTNAGELINIVSERRYVFANTVSKEELDNALTQFHTDRPIITYPGIVYENSTAQIKIWNYDPANVYTVSLKFEGKYRDDILWTKVGDTITVNVPEITTVARRTLSVIIYSNSQGKLQSTPTEASIHIKNLFDINPSANGNDYKRLIFGATPDEWLGLANLKYSFDESKTTASTYTTLQAIPAGNNPIADPAIPTRIAIPKDKYLQSKVINTTTDPNSEQFTGTFLDGYIGLENIKNIKLDIITSNEHETVFAADYTHDEIVDAFNKGTLLFIVDASTASNDSNFQVPNGPSYGKHRYSWRQALEYTPVLNLLPRTDYIAATATTASEKATWYLEHNNKLRGRIIHSAIILDFDVQVDFDFDGMAQINETNNLIETTFPMEKVEYKVQDNIPFILTTLNDPKIPNVNNPYINIGSKIAIVTGNKTLDEAQGIGTTTIPDTGLIVNNIYSERIFSGLHTSLILKDNFVDTQAIMKDSRYYKKFYPFSDGSLFESSYKKDVFMLNEENIEGLTDGSTYPLKDKTALSMARFISDLLYPTDNPSYSVRLKELAQTPTTYDSFKMIYPVPSEDYTPGSEYQANIAIAQYGGSADYIIDGNGTTSKLIEQKISIQKMFIKNAQSSTPLQSGRVPVTEALVKDGYGVIAGAITQKRIPTWWDVVLRPSVRSQRINSLRDIWTLIRDNIPITDTRWLRITDGILRKPQVTQDLHLNGLIHRDHEIVSIQDSPGLFLFGGEGYTPTIRRIESHSVNVDYLNSITPGYGSPTNAGKYFVNEAKWAYAHRDTPRGHMSTQNVTGPDGKVTSQSVWVDDNGWQYRNDIMKIDYGWENGEPYVEYVWGYYYTWSSNYDTYTGIKLFVDRVSRKKCQNGGIYHLDLGKLATYNPGDNDIFPAFITKIYNSDYEKLFIDPANTADQTKAITSMYNVGRGIQNTTPTERANFMDVIYESGAWWFVIRPAFSKDTKLFKMKASYTAIAGGVGVTVNSFSFEEVTNLSMSYADPLNPVRIDTNYSKWSLIKDITGTLRGDGPILIKHQEQLPLRGINQATIEPGIYYFDTWDKNMYKKVANNIPVTSNLFGIQEIQGIRNPYIVQLDPGGVDGVGAGIEDKIDIVGSRFFIITYIDKLLSTLTRAQFLQLKEELLHINNNASTANPQKLVTIFQNIIPLKVRAIIPDGDDYRANSAQIILDRVTTQTGRPASNFVFRVTNRSSRHLEIDSVRFITI